MTQPEFDAVVDRAVRQIPEEYRERLANIVFLVEQEPPIPGLLGLYQGRPMTRRSVFEPYAMPDRITIFQGPHERLARNRAHLESMVADTVWHEVAHYFGMDEGQVRAAERRRARRRLSRRAGEP